MWPSNREKPTSFSYLMPVGQVFKWKKTTLTLPGLFSFSAQIYNMEMGLTSPASVQT